MQLPFVAVLASCVAHVAFASPGLPWKVGNNATLSVVSSTYFSLQLEGSPVQLKSAPSFAHCNSRRFVDGTELTSGPPVFRHGYDYYLGSFEILRFELSASSDEVAKQWAPPQTGDTVLMTLEFQYYYTWDSFQFIQSFPVGCSKDLNMSALPPNATAPGLDAPAPSFGESQYHSALATSTGFPCFDASAGSSVRSDEVGYSMWRGTFSDLGYSKGQALTEWLGGAETGPTVLFSADDAADAMVLSAADSFFTATVGQANCRQLDPSLGATASAGKGHPASDASCALHPNTDFMGNDLGSVTVDTFQECCDACLADPQCTCWTFDGNNTGRDTDKCWLKTSTAGNQSASHMSGTVCAGGQEQITMGVQGYEAALAGGASFPFVVFPRSGRGLQAAMYEWGAFLRTSLHTQKLGPDVTDLLGYGTDNGAYYSGHIPMHSYYLTNVTEYLREQKVPIRYMQLDPWWFSGQPAWVANPETFPQGIVEFQKELQVPLLLYSFSWNPYQTPQVPAYKERGFKFLNSRKFLQYRQGKTYLSEFAQSDGVTSEGFYDYIIGIYHDQHRVMVAYETDFMDRNVLVVNGFLANSYLNELWVNGQDAALAKRGLTWQHCMNLPSYALDSLKRPSITNARASTDANPTIHNRWRIGYTGVFLDPLGVRPFFDNIWTVSEQPGNYYNSTKPNIEMDAAISLLSSGPVWIADMVGLTNRTVAMQTCREDGLLLRPSRAITPIDAMFALPKSKGGIQPEDAANGGEVWATHSDLRADAPADPPVVWNGTQSVAPRAVNATRDALPAAGITRSYTILAVDVQHQYALDATQLWPPSPPQQAFLAAPHSQFPCPEGSGGSDCGVVPFGGSAYAKLGLVTGPGNVTTRAHSHVLWTAAPILSNGWALLGEVHKIEWRSPQRILLEQPHTGGVDVVVAGVTGEAVVLQCVAPDGGVHSLQLSVSAAGTARGTCGR